jgi:hypothetical protein
MENDLEDDLENTSLPSQQPLALYHFPNSLYHLAHATRYLPWLI